MPIIDGKKDVVSREEFDDMIRGMEERINALELDSIAPGEDLVRTRGIDFSGVPHIIQIAVFTARTNLQTGDGAAVYPVNQLFDGEEIVTARGVLGNVGNQTADTLIQIHNVTNGQDILSTRLQIDSSNDEIDSEDSATPVIIDTAQNGLTQGDLLRVDVDQIDGGNPSGLWIVMEAFPKEAPKKKTDF